jgi:uncharacterized protein YegL
MNQIDINNDNSIIAGISDAPPVLGNETRMALIIGVDTSASMAYDPGTGERAIDALNRAMNGFKAAALKDPSTKDILDVCILRFNHETVVAQDWVDIGNMQPVELVAEGGTAFVPMLRKALEKRKERADYYKKTIGPNYYKPWILMITDGKNEHGESVDTIAPEIRALDEAGKQALWAFGVGNYDPVDLHKLTDRVVKLDGYDFSTLFDWVHKSMASVSQSAPGQKPAGVDLPDGLDKDTNGWM